MKKYSALQCAPILLWVIAVFLIANNFSADGFALLLGIKSANAQEWPAPKNKEFDCPVIQGKFRNAGEDAPSNNRASRSPPWLSSNVLSSGWPGKNLVQVKIEALGDTILRFWFIDQSEKISEVHEFKSICKDGWWTFSASVSGGLEGWHGTQTTFVQLTIAADDTLLARVMRRSKGKDFGLFPRESSENFEYRFLKD